MLELSNKIELKSTDSQNWVSFETRYLVQINFTFDFTVKSHRFLGTSPFCVRKDEIEKLCNDLHEMVTLKKGKTTLNDNDSVGFVKFEINELGRVTIQGQIGETYGDHFLKFKFTTDNISAEEFIKDFKYLLFYVDEKK